MSFSERYGHRKVRDVIQIDSMNEELRGSLWSVLHLHIWEEVSLDSYTRPRFMHSNAKIADLVRRLWFSFYKKPLDTVPDDWPKLIGMLRREFFEYEWFEVYDFIEFVAENYPFPDVASFTSACNFILEREGSAYRFVDTVVTRITDEEEVAEIEKAVESIEPVRTHLQRALELLSDRKNPDYRNSIKESISAVESLVATVLGQRGTLGQLVKKLEDEAGLHPALKSALSSLYGYTSDEDGIRHAILEQTSIGVEDARFFLVICSAFANYVNAKVPSVGAVKRSIAASARRTSRGG
jgi:hypothetical protein